MSFNPLLMSTQPAVKLVTANLEMMMRFTSSPEVLSHAMLATSQMVQQAGAHTLQLMQTDAFARLVQGMMRNYTEFLGESGRDAVTWMQEGQTALIEGARDAADTVVERATPRSARSGKRR